MEEIRCPHCNSILPLTHIENPDHLLTIGELIAQLEGFPLESILIGRIKDVQYTLLRIESWRGIYALPSIDFVESDPYHIPKTIKDYLVDWEVQIGKTMQGYKGGEYPIHKDLQIRLAKWGELKSYRIQLISQEGGFAILDCEEIPDDD